MNPRILTLKDLMKKFPLLPLTSLLHSIHAAQLEAQLVRGLDKKLDLDWIQRIAAEGSEICKYAGFTRAESSARSFVYRLRSRRVDASAAETELLHIEQQLLQDMHEFLFLQVDAEYRDDIDNEKWFGEKVSESFSTVNNDVRDAGNCFTVGLWTAAVFHLMRVAERGLRALAYDRRVRVPKGPLELANWEEIIRELEKAEDAIKQFPKTLARESQYKFYHSAMMELRALKNVYRNPGMHTRAAFNEHEAKACLEHVRSLMQTLATKISEGKRTPIIWKKP